MSPETVEMAGRGTATAKNRQMTGCRFSMVDLMDAVSNCLSVSCSKRKMAPAINTKVDRDIVHGRSLACIDANVKRSKGRVMVTVRMGESKSLYA